jgi:hypothetical protein
MAGSWRFDTYFGRDTLVSLRLLMPVLTANAVQNGLASVLDRLSPSSTATICWFALRASGSAMMLAAKHTVRRSSPKPLLAPDQLRIPAGGAR